MEEKPDLLKTMPFLLRDRDLEDRVTQGYLCPGLPGGRLPRGALTELSGPLGCGKTEWLLREVLAQHPTLRIAWIERQSNRYPLCFPQHQVSLERVLFIEAGDQGLWSAQQVLRSGIFGFIVLEDVPTDAVSLKKLQLAAEKAESAVILLRETPTPPPNWALRLALTWQGGADPLRPWKKVRER